LFLRVLHKIAINFCMSFNFDCR